MALADPAPWEKNCKGLVSPDWKGMIPIIIKQPRNNEQRGMRITVASDATTCPAEDMSRGG